MLMQHQQQSTDLITLRGLEQSLDFTQITLRIIFLVELVHSSDLGSTHSDASEVLVGCILELVYRGYF